MKSGEGFSDMLDKTILIELVNENVTLLNKRFKKAASSGLFFTSS